MSNENEQPSEAPESLEEAVRLAKAKGIIEEIDICGKANDLGIKWIPFGNEQPMELPCDMDSLVTAPTVFACDVLPPQSLAAIGEANRFIREVGVEAIGAHNAT